VILTATRVTSSKPKTTCPALDHCGCYIHRNRAVTTCPREDTHGLEAGDLTNDLARFYSTAMEEVTIHHFNFTVLPANVFANLSMTSLSISDGPLETVEDSCFEGVLKMDKLTIELTHLRTVPVALLRLGARLKELRLAHNGIEEVGDVLHSLVNLEKLDLESNAVASLDEKLFDQLKQLTELRLGNNKLHRLPIQSLRVPPLAIVDVHNNVLMRETANAFRGFRQLR
ncbi:unnamed protein product, partial [Ixodes hexagonus]